jgi:heterodisulfide reductase subunit C
MISSIIFIILFVAALLLFYRNVSKIFKNINRGNKCYSKDDVIKRIQNLYTFAIGQSKMLRNPIVGVLHVFIYIGFILFIIELLEIVYDGITNQHRLFSTIHIYPVFISLLETFAVGVIIACTIFLVRRNVLRIKRFISSDVTGWPRLDANIILIALIVLMTAFLLMNSADLQLQSLNIKNYSKTGNFLVSGYLQTIFASVNAENLVFIEQFAWWVYIIGILAFINYIPFSKHFHIILAFPNVYYSKIKPLSYIEPMESVSHEVKIAMGLKQEQNETIPEVLQYGAKDVIQLNRKSLLDAYSCTECGRCTMVCPANLAGKKLSPRKIMMNTRDRLEQLGKEPKECEKSQFLLRDYISEEEIWACTTCYACSYECPVNINPVAIIIELRRYLVMEESSAPASLNSIFVNIENNGAPWQYSSANRDNWTNELCLNK